MLNTVIIIGSLTRDIELQYTQDGAAIAKSTIATFYKHKTQDSKQKKEVCFLDFTMFGKIAEVANQHLRKGSKVLLEGRLILEQWKGTDGQNRSKHSLRVENMKMLIAQNSSTQGQEQNQGYGGSVPQSQGNYNQPQNGGYNNRPQQNQYQQYNQQPRQPQAQQPQHNISEIDIDEDEIPF
ncbi:MAG: hypothetical protein KN64_00725 [Sulfurovum sp. AS07-7]|nr:MAG: hypothetical protein KN64_00725 [Sulfurovum sp. AS07-7]